MQKDYAKYTFKKTSPWLTHGWRYRLVLVVFIVCLIASIGYAYYLYDKYADRLSFAAVRSFFVHKEKKEAPIEVQQEEKPENDIQFNFYTELPSGKEVLPTFDNPTLTQQNEIGAVPAAPATESVKKGQYILQVAAFKNPSAAGELRISLLLAGFEADIVKSLTEDQQPLYLIQLGPYPSANKAKAVQDEMKGKGIESVIKKAP